MSPSIHSQPVTPEVLRSTSMLGKFTRRSTRRRHLPIPPPLYIQVRFELLWSNTDPIYFNYSQTHRSAQEKVNVARPKIAGESGGGGSGRDVPARVYRVWSSGTLLRFLRHEEDSRCTCNVTHGTSPHPVTRSQPVLHLGRTTTVCQESSGPEKSHQTRGTHSSHIFR